MSEDVRPVPFAPGYFVSSEGHIYSDRRGLRRRLRAAEGSRGYLHVSLYVDGAQVVQLVHRLVCEAFHGAPPDAQEVRHLDGSRTNNAAANLAWGTRRQNMADKRAHGTAQVGSRNPRATLTEDAVERIRARAAAGESQTGIAADYGIRQANVSAVVRGETWAHVQMPNMVNRRARSGERHMSAKLTAAAVADIRRRAASGESGRKLAIEYGVTQANISMIVRRRTWNTGSEAA